MRALLGDLRSVCLGIVSVSNLTSRPYTNFANRVPGSDATQHKHNSRKKDARSITFMNDLKLYGNNSSQIDSLIQTVWSFSEDILE